MLQSVSVFPKSNCIIINSSVKVRAYQFKSKFKKVYRKEQKIEPWKRVPPHIREQYTLMACEKLLRKIGFS